MDTLAVEGGYKVLLLQEQRVTNKNVQNLRPQSASRNNVLQKYSQNINDGGYGNIVCCYKTLEAIISGE